MLKALAKVHNPQEKEELVGDDFEDYKADIITKVVEVLGIVPNLESSNDSSNSTHQIAKTTLSSAEYLSHLLTTEPNHQQVSIEYVKEVAAVVLKSLQGAHINDDDIHNLTRWFCKNVTKISENGEKWLKLIKICLVRPEMT